MGARVEPGLAAQASDHAGARALASKGKFFQGGRKQSKAGGNVGGSSQSRRESAAHAKLTDLPKQFEDKKISTAAAVNAAVEEAWPK